MSPIPERPSDAEMVARVARRGPVTIGGIPVVTTVHLPRHPTDGENARRIVRHGLAEALPWLDINPGPRPDEPIEMVLFTDLGSPMMFVSEAGFERLREEFQR